MEDAGNESFEYDYEFTIRGEVRARKGGRRKMIEVPWVGENVTERIFWQMATTTAAQMHSAVEIEEERRRIKRRRNQEKSKIAI